MEHFRKLSTESDNSDVEEGSDFHPSKVNHSVNEYINKLKS